MDVYGIVDDLLDLPSDDFFVSSSSSSSATATATAVSDFLLHDPSSATNAHVDESPIATHSIDFTDILSIPTDDAVELEWLSNYMDDSFTDFSENQLNASVNFHSIKAAEFHGRSRSKCSMPSTSATGETQMSSGSNVKEGESFAGKSSGTENNEVARRCTHCASEKTPQWRIGPLGPKTLCNACGVRYKSARLLPEYRPAASPTFMLTQHSNSHRKVLELRRQKELLRQQQQQQQQEAYGRHFRVC